MVPFVSEYFFYMLFVLMIPAIVLGLLGKQIKYYGLFVTIALLPAIYNTRESLLFLAIFFALSWLAATLYAKAETKNPVAFWCVFIITLLPLAISKAAPGLGWFHLVGISYMTFRTLQFVIGIKEGKVERVRLFNFAYFVLFFPAVSSGPIDRLRRFEAELAVRLDRAAYLELLREGIWKIFNGLLYSFAIAPAINAYLLEKLGGTGVGAIIGYGYVYTFYLFFNFAGYSKLAIGTAYIFGVKMPENFNMPFLSRDLKEFWARWHMSMSTFFRDYVYNKFVVMTLKKKTFKNPHIGSYIGYIITMLVMGLWHGLSLHFIVYGLYHGLLMCINDVIDNNLKGFKKFKNTRFGGALCTVITLHVFAFSLLIFSGKLF